MDQPLDMAAVSAALQAKGAERCPICSEIDTATALAPTFIPVPGVVPIGSTDPNRPHGIEAVCVTCVNCGFIRMHDVLELLEPPASS